jgi:uncharacterized membrane protein
MSSDTSSPMTKKAFLVFAIFTGLNGLGCAFYQQIIGTIYEYNAADPEILRLFGLALVAFAYLAFLASKSNSREVSVTVARGLLIFGVLGIVGLIMNHMATNMQSLHTYVAIGVAYAIQGGLMLIPLKCCKK